MRRRKLMWKAAIVLVLLLGLSPVWAAEVLLISSEGISEVSFPTLELPPGSLGIINGDVFTHGAFKVWSDLLSSSGWSVVNVGWRDVPAIEKGVSLEGISILSANVKGVDQAFVVWETQGRKLALIGVTMPHHGHSVETVTDPVAAVKKALSEVRSQADGVILLAHMSREQAADLLRKADGVDVCLVSGRASGDPEPLKVGESWVLEVPWGGSLWGRTVLRFDDVGKITGVSHRFVAPKGESSEKVAEAKRKHGLPVDPFEEVVASTKRSSKEVEAAEPCLIVNNRACLMTVHGVRERSAYGTLRPEEGRCFLVLDVGMRNIIPMTLVRKVKVPTQYRIPNLADNLYMLVNSHRLARLHRNADKLPGHFPVKGLALDRLGAKIRGNLVFEIPAEGVEDLELRLYDYAHGHIFIPLLPGRVEEEEPLIPLQQNEVLEAGIYGFKKSKNIAGRKAPDGMTFITVDLRGRSLYTFEKDATAFDPKAKPGDKIHIGTVADWLETHKYLTMVVDGEYRYAPEPETALPETPRFLPDVPTGEKVVFLVPEEFRSLELRCNAPNARTPDGVTHPEPLLFVLEGKRPPLPERKAIASIKDDVFNVSVVGQTVLEEFAGVAAGSGKKFLVLDVAVANTSNKGDFIQTRDQFAYVLQNGNQIKIDELTLSGPYAPAELVRIPPGERRTFQLVYRIPAGETMARLAYRGYTLAEVLNLNPMR